MYKKFCDAFIVSYYLQAMILPTVLFYFFNLKWSMMKQLSNPCQFKHSFWPNRALLSDLSSIRREKGPINNVDRREKKYRKCVYTYFILFYFIFIWSSNFHYFNWNKLSFPTMIVILFLEGWRNRSSVGIWQCNYLFIWMYNTGSVISNSFFMIWRLFWIHAFRVLIPVHSTVAISVFSPSKPSFDLHSFNSGRHYKSLIRQTRRLQFWMWFVSSPFLFFVVYLSHIQSLSH